MLVVKKNLIRPFSLLFILKNSISFILADLLISRLASVNVLSKRPGTALPKAAKGTKGVALRPTTAHPTAKKESALTPDVLLPAPIKEMIARPKSALPKPKPKPKVKI